MGSVLKMTEHTLPVDAVLAVAAGLSMVVAAVDDALLIVMVVELEGLLLVVVAMVAVVVVVATVVVEDVVVTTVVVGICSTKPQDHILPSHVHPTVDFITPRTLGLL